MHKSKKSAICPHGAHWLGWRAYRALQRSFIFIHLSQFEMDLLRLWMPQWAPFEYTQYCTRLQLDFGPLKAANPSASIPSLILSSTSAWNSLFNSAVLYSCQAAEKDFLPTVVFQWHKYEKCLTELFILSSRTSNPFGLLSTECFHRCYP